MRRWKCHPSPFGSQSNIKYITLLFRYHPTFTSSLCTTPQEPSTSAEPQVKDVIADIPGVVYSPVSHAVRQTGCPAYCLGCQALINVGILTVVFEDSTFIAPAHDTIPPPVNCLGMYLSSLPRLMCMPYRDLFVRTSLGPPPGGANSLLGY